MENMITVKNLRKEFKKTIKEPGIKGSIKSFFNPKSEIVEAVKDISFTAEKGEILGFIGPNGAGKSTGKVNCNKNAYGYSYSNLGYLRY